MVRHPWISNWRLIAAAAVLLATSARAAEGPPEGAEPGPAGPDREPPRINLFLNAPLDMEAVWKALKHPDFVLIKGSELEAMLERARRASGASATAANVPAVVDSVAIEGTVADDRADLTAALGITMLTDGPAWVPIRLDDLTVTDVREGDRALPPRAVGGVWQVELRGKGAHAVRVDFKVKPKATADGRQVAFAIPEAASTRFRWEIAERIAEATVGTNEPVDRVPIAEGARARLAADLTPRARLEVSWRAEAEPGAQLPPLLSIQGEIAIDLEPGSFKTRSSWSIHAVRGSSRTLRLLLDPADVVLEVELDGQSVSNAVETIDGESRLSIALAEPLRPGPPRSLVMTTRRAFPATVPPKLTFRGFSLTDAREQSGAIGIAQSGNLWVSGVPERGLRRVDPRTELPVELRARPGTVLAYQFVDQPFELTLRVDASPPLVRTEARSTVALSARRARVETWLDYQTAHGRLFEVRIGLPRGLELESVGPKEFIESSRTIADPLEPGTGAGTTAAGGARVLTVRLTPKAREGNGFSLHLLGGQTIDPERPVSVALFQPREATSGGGQVAVFSDRDLTVDLENRASASEASDAFRPAVSEPPADWPWPAPQSAPVGPPALWLRHDGNPPALPLEVTVHPRTISNETTLLVQIDRRKVEVEQVIESAVQFGTRDALDILVPPSLDGSWEVEGRSVASRSDLGLDSAGNRRFRLKFVDEVGDRARLRFRYRLPSPPSLLPDQPAEIAIPWLRPAEGTEVGVRASIAAEPSIDLALAGTGWTRTRDDEAVATTGEDGAPIRLVLAGAGKEPAPLRLIVRARALTELPPLVASRLWLRTIQGPDGTLHASASYWIETHEGSLSIALPEGANWSRLRAGGETIPRVELLPKRTGYRVAIPARLAHGPLAIELEYTVPSGTSAWEPPRLLNGLVQQTLWEVRIPWGRAVVGEPPGWSDENEWYWDQYVWKRRPCRDLAALAAWASGNAARPSDSDPIEDAARGDSHGYLFGRPGPPVALRPWIISRAALVAICSGTVLAVGGFLILFRRPPVRVTWAAALALGLAAATAVQPSVTFLAAQSAMIGIVFTLLTALMHQFVHQRRRPMVFGETSGLVTPSGPGSTLSRALSVGSDDSTAIRARPTSTVDHLPTGLATPPESVSGRSPRGERSG